MWEAINAKLKTDAKKVIAKGAISLTTAIVGVLSAPAFVNTLDRIGILPTINQAKLHDAILALMAGIAGMAWNWWTHRDRRKTNVADTAKDSVKA